MNFYKHHLGDYDGATAHLTWTEDMAYTRLLRAYYRREQGFADIAEACRLVRAQSKAEKQAVSTVLAEFFSQENGEWHNKRADEEIAAYQAQAATNRRIARQRTVNEPSTNRSPATTEKREPNHKPEPLTRTSKPQGIAVALPDWLEKEKWNAYVKTRPAKARTPDALKAAIEKLDAFRAAGHDPNKIVAESLANGWHGLFAPKAEGNGGNGKSQGLPWWSSNEGIQAKAAELHVEPRKGESWNDLKARVSAAMEARA